MVMESLVNADVARYQSDEKASSFLNLFIPTLGNAQCSELISKSSRFVCM